MQLSDQQKAELFIRRFKGRPDVYARKWYDKEGKGNYSPVCANIWKERCHLKLKDGISCAKCEIREFTHVSTESVLKHIKGVEEHSIYVVKENGMINFGAIDFDCKPNKDPKNSYYFEDVKKVSEACDALGIKHAIARSTSDGFHLYMFFDKEYPAVKFIAVVRALVFERSGIAENARLGIKMPPELFPKQTSPGGAGGLGNPIKPPMIEDRWVSERNCWVDATNKMIPPDQQWAYFEKIPNNTAETFDILIEDFGLEIKEEQKMVTSNGKTISIGSASYNKETGEWVPPSTGSMEKLIEGCAAFRRLREKMDTGYSPSHDEGFALFHCGALHTQDGVKYFESGKIPGWGQTDKDWRQLMQSIDKNYAPWTCKTMQVKGVCVPGTKCFNKKPPEEIIEGQKVVHSDLPEDQWPDPSPIRYSKSEGDDFLQKLINELDALKDETDTGKQGRLLREIALRAQVFDKDQQTILKQHAEKLGLMKKREIGTMFKQAEKERSEELTKTASSRADVRNINNTLYRKKKPYGYEVSKKIKGNSDGFNDIANFDMVIKEIKTVIDDDDPLPKFKFYRGVFCYDGVEKPFEISADDFFDNSELFKFIGKSLDMRAGIQKPDIEDFRTAVNAFSTGKVEEVIYRGAQGWYDDVFLMPKVMVDKLGTRTNDSQPLDVGRGSHAQYLNFKFIADSEIREVLFHMKTELFKAFPRGPLFIGLSHTLLGGIIGQLGFRQKPTLWYEGVSGRGKSTMTYLFQQFYGNFPLYQNWTGTYKGMLDNCHRFKDTTLVIDDYKGQNEQQKQAAEMTIQYGYDGNSRSVLSRDGTQRGDKGSRCLLICSGEDTPFGQASIISRMLIVPYPQVETTTTRIAYEACLAKQDNYCAVTPKFIHYFLNKDVTAIRKEIADYETVLLNEVQGRLNAPRICMHYAWNFITWKLFIGFMLEQGVIEQKEHDAFLKEHEGYVRQYRDLTLMRCAAEQHGRIFVDALKEIITSGRVSIAGMPNFEHEHAKVIGFVRPQEQDVVYLYPGVTISEVRRESVHMNFRISAKALGEQMISDGIISEHDKNEHTKMVVDPNLSKEGGRVVRSRMWRINIDRLGMEGADMPILKPVPLPLSKPPIEEGLI